MVHIGEWVKSTVYVLCLSRNSVFFGSKFFFFEMFATQISAISKFLEPFQEFINFYPLDPKRTGSAFEEDAMSIAPHGWVESLQSGSGECPSLTAAREAVRRFDEWVLPFAPPPQFDTLHAQHLHVLDSIRYPRNRISDRKTYEVDVLSRFVFQFCKKHSLTHVVDIGGGRGQLSQCVTRGYGVPTTSIDRKRASQVKGVSRHGTSPRTTYRVATLSEPSSLEDDSPTLCAAISKPYCLSVGLHTCGSLAVYHLRTAVRCRSRAAINIGCCFSALDLTLVGLSQAFRENCKFVFTVNALHVANLGDAAHIDWEAKTDRYSQALYVAHHRESLSPPCGSFSQFMSEEKNQEKVKRVIFFRIAQGVLSRALEILLLLDRAAYLEEEGYSVSLGTMFPRSVSTRNIALVATSLKKCHGPLLLTI